MTSNIQREIDKFVNELADLVKRFKPKSNEVINKFRLKNRYDSDMNSDMIRYYLIHKIIMNSHAEYAVPFNDSTYVYPHRTKIFTKDQIVKIFFPFFSGKFNISFIHDVFKELSISTLEELNFYKFHIMKVVKKLFRTIEKYLLDDDKKVNRLNKFKDQTGGPLGNWVWPQRHIQILSNLEDDTEIEQIIYSELKKHFEGSAIPHPEAITAIQNILAQGLYPKTFNKPKQQYIYRGMSVDSQHLSLFTEDKDYMYKPRNGGTTSSWSKKEMEAIRWAKKNLQSTKDVAIVLIADVSSLNSQNKLLDAHYLYQYIPIIEYKNEAEVIAFGEIPVHEIRILE